MVIDPFPLIPATDPQSSLEQAYIDDFLRTHGHDAAAIRDLPAPERERVMRQATAYASGKLCEVECRAHLVHEIHGAQEARKPPPRG